MKTTVPTIVKLALTSSSRGRKAASQYRAAGVLLVCGAGNAAVSAVSAVGVVCLAPITGAELIGRKIWAAGARLRSAVSSATAAAATAAAVANATPVDATVSQPEYSEKPERAVTQEVQQQNTGDVPAHADGVTSGNP